MISIYRSFEEQVNRLKKQSWKISVLMAGRGCGKTYQSAKYICDLLRTSTKSLRIGFIGSTYRDVYDIMLEQSFFYHLNQAKIDYRYYISKSRVVIYCKNLKHQILLFGAQDPHSLRGYEFDYVWMDEWLKYPKPLATLQQAELCLRIGESKCIISTTPMAKHNAIDSLNRRSDVRIIRGSSQDNVYLSDNFQKFASELSKTAEGRQEVLGNYEVRTLWKPQDIKIAHNPPKFFDRYILGIDIAVSDRGTTGIILIGVNHRHSKNKVYVLEDYSVSFLENYSWIEKVKAICDKYKDFPLNVYYESNQGGLLIEQVMRLYGICVPLFPIFSKDNKKHRAYLTSLLYSRCNTQFVKNLPKLKDEMLYQTKFDRIDALANCFSNIRAYL